MGNEIQYYNAGTLLYIIISMANLVVWGICGIILPYTTQLSIYIYIGYIGIIMIHHYKDPYIKHQLFATFVFFFVVSHLA